MATKVEIINRALTKLGARPITSTDDSSEEARIANRVYTISLESILSECLWTFATKRVNLAQVSDEIAWSPPGTTLSYAYQVPNDTIRIFGVSDDGATWYREGDIIFSDTASLGIIYVWKNESPGTYIPKFSEAFSDKLAHEMSFSILNSGPKSQALLEYYESVSLPKAKSENSQTGTPPEMNDEYWVNSKWGGPQMKEFQ